MITLASRSDLALSRDVAEQMVGALNSPALQDYCREQLRASKTPEEHRATLSMIAEILGDPD